MKRTSKPHRIRYWLNAKQKDDPTFAIQVQLICATYGERPVLYEKFRTHTISTDEMTGIQALERIARPKRSSRARKHAESSSTNDTEHKH